MREPPKDVVVGSAASLHLEHPLIRVDDIPRLEPGPGSANVLGDLTRGVDDFRCIGERDRSPLEMTDRKEVEFSTQENSDEEVPVH